MLEMEAGKSLFCSRSSATSRLLEFLQVVPGRRVYGETILGWGLLTTSAFIVPRSCSRRHSSNDVWNIFRPTQNLPQFARRSSQFLQSGTCPSPPDGIKRLPLIAALSLQWTLGRGGGAPVASNWNRGDFQAQTHQELPIHPLNFSTRPEVGL